MYFCLVDIRDCLVRDNRNNSDISFNLSREWIKLVFLQFYFIISAGIAMSSVNIEKFAKRRLHNSEINWLWEEIRISAKLPAYVCWEFKGFMRNPFQLFNFTYQISWKSEKFTQMTINFLSTDYNAYVCLSISL